MVLCLAVHLARNAECVVADFCEIDSSDQFWIDPSQDSGTESGFDLEASAKFIDEIEAHRVVWFRTRRITLLAARESQ